MRRRVRSQCATDRRYGETTAEKLENESTPKHKETVAKNTKNREMTCMGGAWRTTRSPHSSSVTTASSGEHGKEWRRRPHNAAAEKHKKNA